MDVHRRIAVVSLIKFFSSQSYINHPTTGQLKLNLCHALMTLQIYPIVIKSPIILNKDWDLSSKKFETHSL